MNKIQWDLFRLKCKIKQWIYEWRFITKNGYRGFERIIAFTKLLRNKRIFYYPKVIREYIANERFLEATHHRLWKASLCHGGECRRRNVTE